MKWVLVYTKSIVCGYHMACFEQLKISTTVILDRSLCSVIDKTTDQSYSNVGLRPTTHRACALPGEMNPPYALRPYAAAPRTARSRGDSNLLTVCFLVFY